MNRAVLIFAGLVVFTLVSGVTGFCRAEGLPQAGRPSDLRPDLPDYLPETPDKGLSFPSLPIPDGEMTPGKGFQLKGIVLEGNTVFKDNELLSVVRPFLGAWVTLVDLEEMRYRLTRKYVDMGYINSGVLLKPDQNVDEGRVVYQVMEGRLDHIRVTGNGRLKPVYIEERIWPDSEAVFHVPRLRERFQLLLQDPLIEKMNGGIRPGQLPGQAFLDLDIQRARPYGLKLMVDNHRPPATGSLGGTLAGTLWNLSGSGDRLDTSLGLSRGSKELAARFSIPLYSRGTRFSLGWDQNENSVIEAPLDRVDIENESRNVEVNFTHRFVHSLGRTFDAGVSLAVRRSQTFLRGRPFSFSQGAEDGKSRVTALRFIQSFVDRTPNRALVLRSTLSMGLDLCNATVHSDGRPDGRFITWLGQVHYARRLGDRFGQVILRGDLQMADDNLLSLEQFALGGGNSVRGYRENERVRDNGGFFSLEWRYPLWEGRGEKRIEAALFSDLGFARNRGEGTDRLHSLGLGILWHMNPYARAEFYWAHDLEKAGERYEHDLQDEGIHFSFTLDFFPVKG